MQTPLYSGQWTASRGQLSVQGYISNQERTDIETAGNNKSNLLTSIAQV